jgi:6-phosphogluconolactonase
MTRPTCKNDNVKVLALPNAESASRKAAELFAESAAEAIRERRVFRCALAGGSTPKRMYELLATDPQFAGIDWPHVRVFFTDERCVGPDDEQSNYRMVREALLDRVKVCPNCVHRIRGELTSVPAADLYEHIIRDEFPTSDDRLDFVLLGLGADGHTASLFPNTEALTVDDVSCFGNEVPQLDTKRVTLTYPFLNRARRIVFLVTGQSKAAAVRNTLTAPVEVQSRPAQGIRPANGNVVWTLDSFAVAELPSDVSVVVT